MAKIDRIICPLMGGKPCIEDGTSMPDDDGKPINVACRFWVVVRGQDPQTGADVDKGDCAMAWQPVLMIENSKYARETGAAVESLRNENVTTGHQITQALLNVAARPRADVRIEKTPILQRIFGKRLPALIEGGQK